MSPPDFRPTSKDMQPFVEHAREQGVTRWWGPIGLVVVGAFVCVVARSMVRRRMPDGRALLLAAIILLAGGVALGTHYCLMPYFPTPQYESASSTVEYVCTPYGYRGPRFVRGLFGGTQLRVAVHDEVTLTVVNAMKQICHFRIPALQVDLEIPPGELRYTPLHVDEPMTVPIWVSGGPSEEKHVLSAVPSEDLEQDIIEERIRSELTHRGDDWGAKLYELRGCDKCHALGDKPAELPGPSFRDLYGSVVELSDGSRSIVDADFIAWSLTSKTRPHDIRFEPVDHDYDPDVVRPRDRIHFAKFLRNNSKLTPTLAGMTFP